MFICLSVKTTKRKELFLHHIWTGILSDVLILLRVHSWAGSLNHHKASNRIPTKNNHQKPRYLSSVAFVAPLAALITTQGGCLLMFLEQADSLSEEQSCKIRLKESCGSAEQDLDDSPKVGSP